MVLLPCPTPVARPEFAPMVAICTALELQVACCVRSMVPPEVLVPMAMNWLVCVGEATDCEPGITSSFTMSLLPETLPPPVTVTAAVAEIPPGILAVMVAVPAETPVARPVALTVATAGAFEVQETVVVTSSLLAGCLPWPMMPVAVNWAVWPAASDWVAGVIWMVPTWVLLPHPAIRRPRAALKTPGIPKRFRLYMRKRFTHASLGRGACGSPDLRASLQLAGFSGF